MIEWQKVTRNTEFEEDNTYLFTAMNARDIYKHAFIGTFIIQEGEELFLSEYTTYKRSEIKYWAPFNTPNES